MNDDVDISAQLAALLRAMRQNDADGAAELAAIDGLASTFARVYSLSAHSVALDLSAIGDLMPDERRVFHDFATALIALGDVFCDWPQ